MTQPYSVLKSLLQTEKGSTILPQNQYVFWVDKHASKKRIKESVEAIYKVKVQKVNTLNLIGKKRRVRFKEGWTAGKKKAYVELAAGHKIEVA